MPDLDDLRKPEWDLPTATEIRRRGDRHTRRRRVRASLVALGVGLLVAFPTATVLGPDGPGGGASGGGHAAASWLPTVPADFELDRGLTTADAPPAVLSTPDPGLQTRVPLCGKSHWLNGAPQRATDVLVATRAGGASGHDERLLLVFPDDTTARDAMSDVRRWMDGCPRGATSAGSVAIGLADSADDAESWAYTGPGAVHQEAGPESLLVVRVGNAVLLDRSEGGATSSDSTVDRLQVRAADVVEQMCVFANNRC